ncbi:protein PFC0760c-like [Senna tora]|uniref:Protein PFC0760c-like n=1 Tax=Senna tora TaxID=362788 RepID=A0A834TJ92_9FABA|nr:protein PFC0760c-like [Senna tora]
MERMLTLEEKHKVDFQLEIFKAAQGLFGIEFAIFMRDKKQPAQWWDSYGDQCPELQNFAIRILSLTFSSSECEHRKVRELADLDNINSDDELITEDDVTREVEEGEDEVFEVQNLEDMRPLPRLRT